MRYRPLGNTGFNCSVLSLGGAGIGSCEERIFFQGPVPDRQAVATVHKALELGINLIDTSPFYGDSERKIGLALRERNDRQEIFLCSKTGTHPIYNGYDRENTLRCVENSLRKLGTDYLDLVHIHDPDQAGMARALAPDGAVEALQELQAQGVVRHIGLGLRDHALQSEFVRSGIPSAILPYMDYNLLRQDMVPLLGLCRETGTGVILGSALCMGYLSGKDPDMIRLEHYDISGDIDLEKARAFYAWCEEKSANLLAMNYHWILENPAVSTIVLGAARPEEVEASVAALENAPEQHLFLNFLQTFDIPSIE